MEVLSWRVGDVEVVRVEEAVTPVPAQHLVPGITDVDVEAQRSWADPYVSAEGDLLLSVHTFVVRCGDHVVVVDTCAGNDPPRRLPSDAAFVDRLAAAIDGGLDAIDTVLCTHLHFDHVGWNTLPDAAAPNGRRPTFTNARYLFSRDEIDAADADVFEPAVQPLIDADLVDLIEAGTEHVVVDSTVGRIWTIPTPGHTPGHVSVRIESAGQHALITGDVFHTPLQIALPDRHAAFDEDVDTARATRERLVALAADDGLLVFGTHFPPPTTGHIRRTDAGTRFLA